MSEIDKDREARQWAMFLHLSLLGGFLFPGAGFIAPIVIWQMSMNFLSENWVENPVLLGRL
jgi:uncharacterized protein